MRIERGGRGKREREGGREGKRKGEGGGEGGGGRTINSNIYPTE